MSLIPPRLTTAEDVRWAFRVLRCTEAPDDEVDAIVRRCRSLPELREWILASDGFIEPMRRRRCQERKPSPEDVEWLFRLLRFTELPPGQAAKVTAENASLADVTDGVVGGAGDADAIAAAAPRPSGATVVFSKSMPRSGHHLLVDLLMEYYGREIAYCEFYRDGCCKHQPCVRARHPMLGNRFFIQKSHDFRFDDPVLPDSTYLVQYRHPSPRLQSNWDHYVFVQSGADTESGFRAFARSEADYFIRFWERWVTNAPPRTMVLAYEHLIADPRSSVRRVVQHLDPGPPLDRGALDRVLGIVGRPAASSLQKSGQFRLREAGAYRYQVASLFRDLEARIYAACPGLELPRRYG